MLPPVRRVAPKAGGPFIGAPAGRNEGFSGMKAKFLPFFSEFLYILLIVADIVCYNHHVTSCLSFYQGVIRRGVFCAPAVCVNALR
jgi:hypothetical protein